MNSDEKRLLRHLEDNFNNPTIYTYIHNFYSSHRLADRVLSPGFLISLAVVVVVLYHHLSSDSPSATLEAFPDLLWNTTVRVTPARLLYAVDSWLNPPLFPLPMLQTQTRSTSHAAKSEVLRRVLGMDKAGGIMASVSQAGRRSLSGLSGGSPLGMFKGNPEQPAGLGNVSNSCYQNSVLQGLASLKPLRTYLASVDTQAVTEKKAGTVDTLRQLVADLNNPTNNGKTLWTPSILKSMSTWQQQDAQEYFSKLLDEIDREMARLYTPPKPPGYENDALSSSSVSSSSGKDDTVASQHSDDSGYQSMLSHHPKSASDSLFLRNPLEGLQAQRVACTACGHSDGLSMIPFNCLTLNLGVDGNEHNLYERLDSYTKVEPIPGVECGKCTLLKYQSLITKLIANSGKSETDWPEPYSRLAAIDAALEEDDFDDATIVKKCKIRPEHRVVSTKTKQAVIARPPQSLVIHMNRSVFDERTGSMWKNMAAVRFPSLLDLGPWCLGSARTPEGKEDEQWILQPEESMVAGSESDGGSKISGPIFELRAVVTHYGRHENGHYVAYRRHARRPLHEEKPAKLAGEKQLVEEVDGVAGFEAIDDKKEQEQGKEIREEEEEEESQWWRLSDQNVEKVDEEQVLAQGNVFMLFYDCVDPNSTLVGEEMFEDSLVVQDAPDGEARAELIQATEAPLEPLDTPESTVTSSMPNGGQQDAEGQENTSRAPESNNTPAPGNGPQGNTGEAPSNNDTTEESKDTSNQRGGGDDPNKNPRKDSEKEDPNEADAEESSSEDSSSDSEDEPQPDPKTTKTVKQGQQYRPLTRAEMIARAKMLFAKTAERAAGVPLPDEDEDL